MAILLCLAAGLLPLLITPGLLHYFDVTPKVLVLLASVMVALLLILGKAILPSGRVGQLLALTMGIQVASVLLSTALSTHIDLSVTGTNWRRFGLVTQLALLVFTLIAASTLGSSLLRTLRTVAITGSAIAVYGILQYFGTDPWIPTAAYHAGEEIYAIVRPPGTLGHASYLATYLLFVLFSGLALGLVENQRSGRIAGGACALLSGFALILTGTRAAWLGLLCGLAFLLSSLRPPIKKSGAFVLTVVLLLGVFYVSPAGERLRARVHWIRDDPQGGARGLLWRDTARMAASRWLHGFGPETYGANFPRYQSLDLAKQYPDFYHESPHNIFLDAFAEQGIGGLAGLLGTTALGFYLTWKMRRDSLGVFLGSAYTAMFVSLQFSAFTLPTAFFDYLALGALAGLATAPKVFRLRGLYRAPILAGVLLLGWFSVRLGMADFDAEQAHQAIRRSDISGATRLMERVRGWQPPGASFELGYSRHMTSYSSKESRVLLAALAGREALDSAIRACSYPEERQNAYYHLATLFATQDDVKDTEKSLEGAIGAAPNWFKPHWALARILALTRRYDEARREAALAMERGGSKYPEVKATLDELNQRP